MTRRPLDELREALEKSERLTEAERTQLERDEWLRFLHLLEQSESDRESKPQRLRTLEDPTGEKAETNE